MVEALLRDDGVVYGRRRVWHCMPSEYGVKQSYK